MFLSENKKKQLKEQCFRIRFTPQGRDFFSDVKTLKNIKINKKVKNGQKYVFQPALWLCPAPKSWLIYTTAALTLKLLS